MEARLQQRIQRYGWDAAAPYYHDAWHKQLRAAHDMFLEALDVQPGQRVIETACGSGLITKRLAETVGESGGVLATDISEQMISSLQDYAMNVPTPIVVRRCPADKLDVANEAFNAGICALGLMYVPEPQDAIAELVRSVVQGGTVGALVWGERKNCGWSEIFPIVDAHVSSEVCPLFFGTGAPGALAKIFFDAGLEDVQEIRHEHQLLFDTEKYLVDAVIHGGPVALAMKRFSPETTRIVIDEFLDIVSSYRLSDDSYRIPGEFVTVTGRKV